MRQKGNKSSVDGKSRGAGGVPPAARRAEPWRPSRRAANAERFSLRSPVRFVAPPRRLAPRRALCGAAVGRKRGRVGGGPFRRARWLPALCPAAASSSSASSSPTAARCRSAPPSWYFGVSILVSQVPGPKTGSKRAGACGLPKAGSGRAAGRWRRCAGRAEPRAPGGERRPRSDPALWPRPARHGQGRVGPDRPQPAPPPAERTGKWRRLRAGPKWRRRRPERWR